MSKKETTIRAERDLANERIDRAIDSAARWLRRRGAQRDSREIRRAYEEAATTIVNRMRRR